MGEGGTLCNGLLINILLYAAIISLSLSQFLLHMFNELKATILLINSESNPPSPIANAVKYQMLESVFMADVSVLL